MSTPASLRSLWNKDGRGSPARALQVAVEKGRTRRAFASPPSPPPLSPKNRPPSPWSSPAPSPQDKCTAPSHPRSGGAQHFHAGCSCPSACLRPHATLFLPSDHPTPRVWIICADRCSLPGLCLFRQWVENPSPCCPHLRGLSRKPARVSTKSVIHLFQLMLG